MEVDTGQMGREGRQALLFSSSNKDLFFLNPLFPFYFICMAGLPACMTV